MIDLNFAFRYQFKSDEKMYPSYWRQSRVREQWFFNVRWREYYLSAVKYAKGKMYLTFKIHWEQKFFRYWGRIGGSVMIILWPTIKLDDIHNTCHLVNGIHTNYTDGKNSINGVHESCRTQRTAIAFTETRTKRV